MKDAETNYQKFLQGTIYSDLSKIAYDATAQKKSDNKIKIQIL